MADAEELTQHWTAVILQRLHLGTAVWTGLNTFVAFALILQPIPFSRARYVHRLVAPLNVLADASRVIHSSAT